MHQRREQESLEIHRRIARRLDDEALPVLEKARANLRRWLSDRGEDSLAAVYREWDSLLGSLTDAQVSALLVAEDERSTRLRQSTRPCFDLRHGIAFFGHPSLSGYLSIAASHSGDCWLMKVNGNDSGAIYLWDHEMEEVEPVTFRHLTRAFDSFSQFLAAIH